MYKQVKTVVRMDSDKMLCGEARNRIIVQQKNDMEGRRCSINIYPLGDLEDKEPHNLDSRERPVMSSLVRMDWQNYT